MQQAEPLLAKLQVHGSDASHVATRPIEANNQAGLNWIDSGGEDDWDRCGGGFRGDRPQDTGGSYNDRDTAANQVGSQFRQLANFIVRPTKLDRDVVTFDISAFRQPLAERRQQMGGRLGGAGIEIADHRQRLLLPARHNRPRRRRASEQRDELAPPHHSITSSARTSSEVGTIRSSVLAAFKFINNSNFDS